MTKKSVNDTQNAFDAIVKALKDIDKFKDLVEVLKATRQEEEDTQDFLIALFYLLKWSGQELPQYFKDYFEDLSKKNFNKKFSTELRDDLPERVYEELRVDFCNALKKELSFVSTNRPEFNKHLLDGLLESVLSLVTMPTID